MPVGKPSCFRPHQATLPHKDTYILVHRLSLLRLPNKSPDPLA